MVKYQGSRLQRVYFMFKYHGSIVDRKECTSWSNIRVKTIHAVVQFKLTGFNFRTKKLGSILE